MGIKSKSDIANNAIRMLLQAAGAYYDEARGFKKFAISSPEWGEVLRLFAGSCCYCGRALDMESSTSDHLVPINKTSLGLHAWGNIVPCCRQCNKEKNHKDWRVFIKSKCEGLLRTKRIKALSGFQKKYRYNPSLNLEDVANNLYEDVGEVSAVLIRLRLKQAQEVISSMTKQG